MPHPVTVCQNAYQHYSKLLMAAHEAALKDPNYQQALKAYQQHLKECPECQAAIEALEPQEEPTP